MGTKTTSVLLQVSMGLLAVLSVKMLPFDKTLVFISTVLLFYDLQMPLFIVPDDLFLY